jgi:carboxyl-terminal processing protease
LALAAAPTAARAQDRPYDAPPEPTVLDQAWRILRDQFYDRKHHGVDWPAARERYRPAAARAATQRDVHEAVTAMIGELGASHAALIEPDVYRKFYDAEAKGRLEPQFGLKLVKLEEGFFVSGLLHGGAAAAAGLRRGDRVLALGGRPPDERALSPVPYDAGLGGPRSYRIPCERAGDSVQLELERFQRPKYGRYEATIRAHPWNEVEATRASKQVFEVHGQKIGYLRLYHVLSEDVVTALEEFLAELDDAAAFVLDLRGQGGLPPLVQRTLEFFDRNVRGRPLWDRPVVGLIDGSSRSAKEALAFRWRRRRVGPLVGQTTSGAVLGATFTKLKDGAWLMVPVMDMRSMTGGVVLEGKGVRPDVEVEVVLPWCEGRDAILERGLEVAADRALAARRRGRVHGWY